MGEEEWKEREWREERGLVEEEMGKRGTNR